ncbi:PilW family protein [Chromohalobacter japonicus]|uniref:PilW family protein n=1 Tax=Chromohalobacter japonicus TaxID=223900 RepID=UPI00058D7668|nr:prepilin-type N-terminal cleavage/methylation domain-containing protein [Chromohalobacter japonicus]
MTNQHHQRGFTLIEMMISMFLGLIILGGTITAYQAISSVSEQRDNYYKLQDELMYIHRALASSVKVAESISIKAGDNGNKLSLTSGVVKGDALSKIKCPGFDKDDEEVEWMTVHGSDNDQALKCKLNSGKPVEVIPLVSKGSVGITSIVFCTLPHEVEEKCKSGTSDSGIFFKVDYYDRSCDPDDEGCDSKTLSFRLATRASSSALGVGK